MPLWFALRYARPARENSNPRTVHVFLNDPRTNPNAKTNGKSPLMYIVSDIYHESRIECLKALLDREDILVNEQGEYGLTALMLALREGRSACVGHLLKHPKIDLNIRADEDYHAIHFPASFRDSGFPREFVKPYKQMVENLLNQEGLDLNAQTNQGMTALHFAASGGQDLLDPSELVGQLRQALFTGPLQLICIRALVSKKGRIDLNQVDQQGRTPLDFGIAGLNYSRKIKDHMEEGFRKNGKDLSALPSGLSEKDYKGLHYGAILEESIAKDKVTMEDIYRYVRHMVSTFEEIVQVLKDTGAEAGKPFEVKWRGIE